MGIWMVNGLRGGALRPDERGFAYGDGLFETIAWRQGEPRFLERHLDRLAAGCDRIGLPMPDRAVLAREVRELGAGAANGTLRLTLSRGPGPRGYQPPSPATPTRVLGFFDATGRAPAGALAIGICRTPASVNAALAGMKTLNRLDSVLARGEIARRGLDEGIMCDADGVVVGATAANVFAVLAGRLVTPALAHAGVAGVMRGVVLDGAAEVGLPLGEARIDADALLGAEEIFLTNALTGVRPVASIEGRMVAGRRMAQALARVLRNRGVTESLA